MKKLLLGLLMMLSMTIQAQTKCDWSGYEMRKTYQNYNYFEFRTNLYDDTCITYNWLVYDYQTRKVDTLYEVITGAVQVRFNVKGRYKLGIRAYNRCTDCDTTFQTEIDITVYGEKAKLSHKPSIKDCKTYTFEIEDMNDSCMSYMYEIWDATEYASKMTDKEWKSHSDSMFYFDYEFNENNIEYYSQKSERVLNFTFPDSGRYMILTYIQNVCTEIDTFIFTKIVVCPSEVTASVKNIVKNDDIKIIRYYDLMGKQVDYMRPNEVYIVLYSNGHRRKVMQVQN
jgi:hypothetical protein